MDAKVKMNNDYSFDIQLDDEAKELLLTICNAISVNEAEVIKRFVIGGIALQSVINKEVEQEITRDKSCGFVSLSNILKLFRK